MALNCCVCCPCLPQRFLVILLTALGMLIVHAMRVNIAMTVVTILDEEPSSKLGSDHAINTLPNVTWDSRHIGILHSSFYIGYFMTHLPGGYLAQIFSSQRLFGCSIVISSALNLLLPSSIRYFGFITTCVIRVIQGLSEGVLYPASYAIMRHWTVPQERSTMGGLVLTGIYLGPMVGFAMSGWITHWFSWMYVYYVCGAAGWLWFILWMFCTFETPREDPHISNDELAYILRQQGKSSDIYTREDIPWKQIFTSMPVWALNVCNFARSFVFFFLLTNEPAFLNAFDYNLTENGVLSALPHAVMALVAAMSGPIADLAMRLAEKRRTFVRKLFTAVGFGVEAICMFILATVQQGFLAMVYLTVGVGVSGFTISGWQINHLDLAPRYASVLVAISTAHGTLAGILNPIIIGFMTQQQTLENWHHVLIMIGAVLAFAVTFFVVFGSGELQPWANKETETVPKVIKEAEIYGTFTHESSMENGPSDKNTGKATS